MREKGTKVLEYLGVLSLVSLWTYPVFPGYPLAVRRIFLVKIAAVFMLVLGVSTAALANGGGFGAPEIDPGSAVTALTFVSGAMLLVRGRRRK
jgi:hypothetical protein